MVQNCEYIDIYKNMWYIVYMKKICEYCGIEFETDNVNKRFCTRQCKEKSSKKRIRQGIRYDNIEYNKICEYCGEEFVTKYYDQLYCNECKDIVQKERVRENSKKFREQNPEYLKEYFKTYQVPMYTKICKQCGIEFETRYKNKEYCKSCTNNYKLICEQCGKDFISYSLNNKICEECKKENKKIWYTKECKFCGTTFNTTKKNKKYCSEECRVEYKKELHRTYSKNYRENPNTRLKYKESQRKYTRKRLKEDMEYKIKRNISTSINGKLKKEGVYKNKSTKEYLLDSIKDIKEHLEKQFKPDMNWENHGTLWHIDHIRPQASFKFVNEDGSINEEAIQECWKKENLQPLYKEDNISKGSRYNGFLYKKGEVYTEDKQYKK